METKKEKLFKMHEAQEPFTILEKEGKFKITIGMQILSNDYETLEEAKTVIELKPWWLIIASCYVVSEKIKEFREDLKEIEKFKNINEEKK